MGSDLDDPTEMGLRYIHIILKVAVSFFIYIYETFYILIYVIKHTVTCKIV